MFDNSGNHKGRHSGRVLLPKMLTQLFDQLSDPYMIKDLDSRFIYANQAAAELYYLRTAEDMICKSEYELKSPLSDCEMVVDEWQAQDHRVLQSRKSLVMLEIHPEAVDYPFIVRKSPFYDDNNHCHGVIVSCRKLEIFTLKDFVRNNLSGSMLLTKPDNLLSERECEIIFLKMNGMSSKEVSSRLHLSPLSIENYLQRLYARTGTCHFDQLSDFCQQRQYDRYLPKKFILQQKLTFEQKASHF